MKLLLASRNAKKIAELQRMVQSEQLTNIQVVSLADVPEFPEAPEIGETFAATALAKATDAVQATGMPALADDSGISVTALNGMPGVLSARWAGRHGDDQANTSLVLGQIADLPDDRRSAKFVCAIALVVPGAEPIVVQGEWSGVLVREPRGTNGFGYDPIFMPEGYDRTAAELTAVEKNAVSHRSRALQQLVPHLRALSAT